MTARDTLLPAVAFGLAVLIGLMAVVGASLLAVLLIMLVLVAALTAGRPDRALALFIIVVPIVGSKAVLSAGAFPDLTVYRLLMAWAMVVMVDSARRSQSTSRMLPRQAGRILDWQTLSIAVFLAATLVAGARSPGVLSGIQPWFDQFFLPLIAMYLAARVAWTTRQLRLVIAATFIGGGAWSCLAILEAVLGRSLFTADGVLPWAPVYASVPRSGGVFIAPPVLGTALGVIAVLALGLLLFKRLLPRWAAVAAALLAIAGVVETVTRGSWIALVMGVLVLISFGRGRRIRTLALTSVLVVSLLYMFSAVEGSGGMWERLRSSDEVYNRIVPGATALRLVAEHPLAGLGYGGYARNFGSELQSVGGISQAFGATVPTPHNTVLRVAVESGIVGGIALMGLWLSTGFVFREALRDSDTRWLGAVGLSALVVYIVNAMAIDMVVTSYLNAVFYALLGVIIGACRKGSASQPSLESWSRW